MGRFLASGLIALAACARTEHVAADLQVDVLGALPEEPVLARLCVEAGVARTMGAADGRFALTGLEPVAGPRFTLQLLDAEGAVLGGAGPVALVEDWTEVEYLPCEGCAPCLGGAGPWPGEDAWILAARLIR
ncbi:MAG: hypothetical protein JXX28_04730 [Deltaproteobacteria bacterium]|nr:hypothetical protein [Deltaproteobacteria bacterium]